MGEGEGWKWSGGGGRGRNVRSGDGEEVDDERLFDGHPGTGDHYSDVIEELTRTEGGVGIMIWAWISVSVSV